MSRKIDWLDYMDMSLVDEPQCPKHVIDPLIGFDYISRTKNMFRNGNGCVNQKQLEKIGSGQSGIVYDTMCDDKSGFVTKIINVPRNIQQLYNELYLQQIASSHGLAPKIIECSISDDGKKSINHYGKS